MEELHREGSEAFPERRIRAVADVPPLVVRDLRQPFRHALRIVVRRLGDLAGVGRDGVQIEGRACAPTEREQEGGAHRE
jgi:hypothetical protein